jgi:predicted nucleotidyltransferase
VEQTKAIVRSVRPDAKVHVFGSCATNLRLPDGDIDLLIEAKEGRHSDRPLLTKIHAALRKGRVAAGGSLLMFGRAKVPIIRWTDRSSGLQVDASVNSRGGLETTRLMARSAERLLELRPLILLLKAQLAANGLHETHSGGVGSYLLTNMVRHLLLQPMSLLEPLPRSLRHRVEAFVAAPHAPLRFAEGEVRPWQAALIDQYIDSVGAAAETRGPLPPGHVPLHTLRRHDLGGLLLRFYWYYGHALDTSKTVVMLKDEGTRLAGSEWTMLSQYGPFAEQQQQQQQEEEEEGGGGGGGGGSGGGYLPHDPLSLSLNDPARPDSDIGAKAFRFDQVR